jgi:hypothetical protein
MPSERVRGLVRKGGGGTEVLMWDLLEYFVM